jgi:hypothetical protein
MQHAGSVRQYVYPPVCLSVLSFVHPSIRVSTCMSVCVRRKLYCPCVHAATQVHRVPAGGRHRLRQLHGGAAVGRAKKVCSTRIDPTHELQECLSAFPCSAAVASFMSLVVLARLLPLAVAKASRAARQHM